MYVCIVCIVHEKTISISICFRYSDLELKKSSREEDKATTYRSVKSVKNDIKKYEKENKNQSAGKILCAKVSQAHH